MKNHNGGVKVRQQMAADNQDEHNDKLNQKGAILAAGAILWRKEPFMSDIAIIHRTRYGDEWCLPKGKVKPGETLEAAALREVKEETSCAAKVLRFAGITEYNVKQSKKRVFFWHMQVKSELSSHKGDSEVDQIVWLPPEEAIKLINHADQQDLLKNLPMLNLSGTKFKKANFISHVRYHRLAGSVLAYRTELEQKKSCFKDSGKGKSDWFTSAIKLLSDSERSLNAGNIDEGWKCFHAAQRMEIYSLDDAELKVKAAALVNEAQKLSSWRKGAIEELLGKSGGPDIEIKKGTIYQAALLRDEHYNNQAFKDTLLRNHISILVLLNGILLSVILFDFILKALNIPSFLKIVEIILFGLFGGAFSAVVRVPASLQSSKIPELTHDLRITLLRIFIGAASALIIYLFIESEFIGGIFDFTIKDIHTYYVIAFVSGFSERWVLKAIETVTKER